MGPPVIDVYERCLLGVFQATVCAWSVERVCSRAVDLLHLSIPGPWWRGTRVRTSTGASGTRRNLISPPWEYMQGKGVKGERNSPQIRESEAQS